MIYLNFETHTWGSESFSSYLSTLHMEMLFTCMWIWNTHKGCESHTWRCESLSSYLSTAPMEMLFTCMWIWNTHKEMWITCRVVDHSVATSPQRTWRCYLHACGSETHTRECESHVEYSSYLSTVPMEMLLTCTGIWNTHKGMWITCGGVNHKHVDVNN